MIETLIHLAHNDHGERQLLVGLLSADALSWRVLVWWAGVWLNRITAGRTSSAARNP